jgi:hypothetical protein
MALTVPAAINSQLLAGSKRSDDRSTLNHFGAPLGLARKESLHGGAKGGRA